MASIRIKQIKTDLFGVVDAADPEVFRGVFSAPDHPVRILNIDERVLEQVANGLGIQLKRLGEDLFDYVTGEYHPKADGPAGTQLGNVTEALSYLLLRSGTRGVTRVVSYERGDGVHDFPQPDFFLEEDGQLGSVEVKSTHALDFLTLDEVIQSQSKHRSKQLAPCANVASRRADALRQLGYDGESARPQLHRLVLRDHRVMPFPSDFGIAHVHLVRDGRLDRLRRHQNKRRMRTVRECVTQQRNCWECLDAQREDSTTGTPSEPAHIALVAMHNAPGSLGLLGAGRGGGSWRWAYARWSEALWAREPHAAAETQQTLVSATQEWIAELTGQGRDAASVLRGEWDRYLGSLAFQRGLRDLARQPRFAQAEIPDGFESRDVRPGDEPEVLVVEQLPPRWLDREQPARVSLGRRGRTFSLHVEAETFVIRALSRWWWQAMEVNAEAAVNIAEDMLTAAWEATGGPEGATFFIQGGLQKVKARVEPSDFPEVSLGWQFEPSGDWTTITARFKPRGGHVMTSPWLLALSLGDPRCKLLVHPDGRGYMQLPRALSHSETRFLVTNLGDT
ncbi:hypothetical protein [Sorangium sp. So ce1078]|uniref:hypothetical protein n=1 Tax=Sorangium sp. So ce1078 TaxID=3133329 RepID=UPI003F613856